MDRSWHAAILTPIELWFFLLLMCCGMLSCLTLRFGGTNTFQGNLAFTGGAIYHEEGSSVSGGELIFESNRADVGFF